MVGSKFGRLKISCSAFQSSLLSCKRKSTWNSRNLDHNWIINTFGLDTKRKSSQHVTTSAIGNMLSGDTQNNDNGNDNLCSEVK